MAMDSASTSGSTVATAIQGIGVEAGTPVSPAQLTQIWTIVFTEIKAQLAQASVAPGTFIDSPGPAGGGPISGIGGPVT